jgi:cytochrome b
MRVLVWDLPVRLFHWALAVLVVFSYVTAKLGHSWMSWHVKSGYAILTLLLFRLAWGFAGSSTARFARFVRGPNAALDYGRGLFRGNPARITGHNPLGGWMVLALLAILLLQASTGLFADDEIATQGPLAVLVSDATVAGMSRIHSWNQWAVVAAVAIHVVAIAIYQWGLHRDLVGPMIHGRAESAGSAPAAGPGWLAAVFFALACGAVYYLVVVLPRSP